ncbi:MAG TPA: thioredoxin [Armatimonadetes bacterium]|jgi:thioredoxin 1|nr:thioredoxin [Armatimonadota bacterium]
MVHHDKGIAEVTGSDFDQVVLASKVPVLVDFWAEWCGPCRMVHPILEQIAGKYEGKVLVAKVDVDGSGNHQLAKKYGVRSIPALFLIKDGQVVDEWVGYDDNMGETLAAAIEKAIAEK